MMELLTDLLDRQRAEAGRIQLVLERTGLPDFLGEIAAIYRRWAAVAERRIELQLDEPLPPVRLDRIRVRQILNNLVHNALKHTPRGQSVVIEAHAIGESHVEIAVANEGKGFDPSDTEKMLSLFQRGTSTEPAVGGGHGLGLAIVDRLVKLHGGKLLIEAKPGRGARFAFVVPVDR